MNGDKIADSFQLNKHDVVSIIGSGGKTTLMKTLAGRLSQNQKVGVGTSTKIFCPEVTEYTQLILKQVPKQLCFEKPGIYYFADEHLDNGKLSGLSDNLVSQALAGMDILLIEADGSAGKPLKGWRDDEPVIVPQTTVTIGIVPVNCINKPANDHNIHRLALYLRLTGSAEDAAVAAADIAAVINHPEGLFKKARGRRILYISQVVTAYDRENARQLIELLDIKLDDIVMGDLK